MNISKMLESGIVREWTHPTTGETRYYVQIESLPMVSISRYKSGHVNRASFAGEKISNAAAEELLNSSIWIDADGESHYKHVSHRADDMIETIITALKKKYVAAPTVRFLRDRILVDDMQVAGRWSCGSYSDPHGAVCFYLRCEEADEWAQKLAGLLCADIMTGYIEDDTMIAFFPDSEYYEEAKTTHDDEYIDEYIAAMKERIRYYREMYTRHGHERYKILEAEIIANVGRNFTVAPDDLVIG
jgi:hypothetical protein